MHAHIRRIQMWCAHFTQRYNASDKMYNLNSNRWWPNKQWPKCFNAKTNVRSALFVSASGRIVAVTQHHLWRGRRPAVQLDHHADKTSAIHSLLRHPRDSHYELRDRTHNFSIPIRSTALLDCNFLTRTLYKDLNYSTFSQLYNNSLISNFSRNA